MFVKTARVVNKSVAFLPDTFGLVAVEPLRGGGYPAAMVAESPTLGYGVARYEVGGYWHEIGTAKHVVAFGIVELSISELYLPGSPESLTYGQMLPIAHDDPQGTDSIMYSSVRKLGNSRPYRLGVDIFTPGSVLQENVFDPTNLDRMLQQTTYLPAGSDGWFERKRGMQ